MKASPRQQQILLKLQEHDTLISRLRRNRTQLPERAALADLQSDIKATSNTFMAVQRVRDTQNAEIARIESDIATVRARKERDAELLGASTSSREAQALQTEIDALTVRQDVLEERELEILAILESSLNEYKQAEETLAAVDSRRAELMKAISAAETLIDVELDGVITEREGLAAELQRDLYELYQDIRGRYGLGAARLRGNVSEASNMTLSPTDMQNILNTPGDEIVFCPGTGVILVRTAD